MPSPPALDDAAVRALARDPALFARARELWMAGGVLDARRRGRALLGTVRGSQSERYRVGAEPPPPGRRRRWTWQCDCYYFERYGGPCKHGIALLLAWAHEPERVPPEPSLDGRMAGPARAAALDERREWLRESRALQELLALEPERRRPLRRALDLAPYEAQLRYALDRRDDEPGWQADRLRGLLESAASFLRVGDASNAARLATLLADALLTERPTPRAAALDTLLADTLLLLEAAALDATWPDEERAAWIERVMGWWALGPHAPALADALLDLLLHAHRAPDEAAIERWLRALLRQPIHANRLAAAASRQRALDYLLARYEATGRERDYLDLCWEEDDPARAAHWLAARGSAEAAARLSAEGLGSAARHLSVAEAMHARGEREAARQVAEAGLRYGAEAALLAWLARRDAEVGESERARARAETAWQLAPGLAPYEALRALTPPDEWPARRGELQRMLAAGPAVPHIELLMAEGAWREAAARLDEAGPPREALTEALARAASDDEPLLSMDLLFELAALRAARGPPGYDAARDAVRAAQRVADAVPTLAAPFEARRAAFRAAHRRRRTLIERLSDGE